VHRVRVVQGKGNASERSHVREALRERLFSIFLSWSSSSVLCLLVYTPMESEQSTTTQLLTLLNVSALKSNKRQRLEETPFAPGKKLNARSKTVATEKGTTPLSEKTNVQFEEDDDMGAEADASETAEEEIVDEETGATLRCGYHIHAHLHRAFQGSQHRALRTSFCCSY
jgi:hypothetical protein